jgi:hypothetical protein
MKKSDKFKPPQASSGDTAHLVASAVFSVIPGAPELFRRFVTPPLEKRQFAWMEVVAKTLSRLESDRGLTIDDLVKDDSFASVVLQATSVALRNHHEEKRRALATCIYHAGIDTDLEADLQLAFIRFVDELSPSHVILLQALRDNQDALLPDKSYEAVYQHLHAHLPGNPKRAAFQMMFLELQSHGLIRISQDFADFGGVYSVEHLITEGSRYDLPGVAISEIGARFLDFITETSSAT